MVRTAAFRHALPGSRTASGLALLQYICSHTKMEVGEVGILQQFPPSPSSLHTSPADHNSHTDSICPLSFLLHLFPCVDLKEQVYVNVYIILHWDTLVYGIDILETLLFYNAVMLFWLSCLLEISLFSNIQFSF